MYLLHVLFVLKIEGILRKKKVSRKKRKDVVFFIYSIYNTHYKKCCIFPGAEALAKCKKPWQLDVCQEFCQEQNHQQICSSQMNMPGLQLLAKALAQPLANCVCVNAGFSGQCRLCQHHISPFQSMPGTLRGVNPWQIAYDFF